LPISGQAAYLDYASGNFFIIVM